MIVLRTPKGWTGPKVVDGLPVEGTWRAHQVPLAEVREKPEHLAQLEAWMRSYRIDELFDADGRPRPEIVDWLPAGDRRMGANPHANGGLLTRDLRLPDVRDHAVASTRPAREIAESTRVLGGYLRDVFRLNADTRDFRLFGPDETASNRLEAVYEATAKTWEAEVLPVDVSLATDGRVMEILSETTCQGWLEGYLLTGRHGLFSCYEAFAHIVDSMFNQHAKWLKVAAAPAVAPSDPVAELSADLARVAPGPQRVHAPGPRLHRSRRQQEGRGRARVPAARREHAALDRRSLPPHAELRERDRRRQAARTGVAVDGRRGCCTARAASASGTGRRTTTTAVPTSCMACAGDVPTLEMLAAVTLLREHLPDLKVRVVNVVDLMRLEPDTEHPHGLSDRDYDALFTVDKPVIFAYHGYPWLIHRLTYRRAGAAHLHVRGYKEEGTVTTPFDMVRAQRHGPLPSRDGRDRPRARTRDPSRRTCASTWSTSARATQHVRPGVRRGPPRGAELEVDGERVTGPA